MASDKGLDHQIRKVEKTSLQKFKNQNRVVKKFGSTGLKVYRAIRKTGISISELIEKTGLEQAKLAEILAFLEEKGMIESAEGAAAPEVEEEGGIAEPEGLIEEEKPAKKGRKKEEEAPPEEEKPPEEIVEEKVSAEKEAPEEERIEQEEEPKGKPAAFEEAPEEEEAPLAKKKKKPEPEEIAPVEEEAPGSAAIAPEGEIVPDEGELPKEEEEAAKEAPPEEEEKPAEEEKEPSKEEEDIIPLEMEEGKAAPKEEEEEKIAAQEEEPEPEAEETPEEEEAFLTPGEKKIKDKYGQQGLDVYNLIDGQRTAEEIMKKTGVTEAKLIEMLDFMEKEGIIKLEHPGGKKPSSPPPRAPPSAREEGGFAPMIEGSVSPGTPPAVQAVEGPDFVLDVPAKSAGNLIKEIQLKAALMIKYSQPGVKVLELVDGNRDAVELSVLSGVPLYTVYEILGILKREGLVSLKTASREDIRKKYGEDGYSVYKRYGREGVMLYQLIGKDVDLREMARRTSKDNKKVVEIFMFIHKLLGIDLPIDEDVLLQRLSTPPAEPAAKR